MEKATVLVDSRARRTRSAAVAIAEELGVSLGDIKKPVFGEGVIFLGSGVYGPVPGDYMQRLLRTGTFTGKKIALFATATYQKDGEKMLAAMADTVEKKGATVVGSVGEVRGKLIISRFRHLHPEDLEGARAWARGVAGT